MSDIQPTPEQEAWARETINLAPGDIIPYLARRLAEREAGRGDVAKAAQEICALYENAIEDSEVPVPLAKTIEVILAKHFLTPTPSADKMRETEEHYRRAREALSLPSTTAPDGGVTMDAAIKAIEALPLPDETPPFAAWQQIKDAGIVECVRAAVRATKAEAIEALRALKPDATGGAGE